MQVTIPEFGLVVLVGAAGAGKSTFAAKHFRASEVISSDHYRQVVGDDERSVRTTTHAFEIVRAIAARRLASRRVAVIDATNVNSADRAQYVALARAEHAPVTAIVLDMGQGTCQRQNALRPGAVAPHVITHQRRSLRQSLRALRQEGYRRRYHLRSAEEANEATLVRAPLDCDLRGETGPFDIIGDVHGCLEELVELLETLGYRVAKREGTETAGYDVEPPEGRRALFVGDLIDRGPGSAAALELAMDMVDAGTALALAGNHEAKLAKALQGRDVEQSHGLADTMKQIDARGSGFAERARRFIQTRPSHYLLDEGRLVVAHAGLSEELHGCSSPTVRSFALYGDTTGEKTDKGLPVRRDWAREYRGRAAVVYGHTPRRTAEWVNETICIDTGCVFGGRLSALRWPRREVVAAAARQTYAAPPAALAEPAGATSAQQDSEVLLDINELQGKVPDPHPAGRPGVSSTRATRPRRSSC